MIRTFHCSASECLKNQSRFAVSPPSLANDALCQAPVSRPCKARKQRVVRNTGNNGLCALGATTARGLSPQIICVLKDLERSAHASLGRKCDGNRPSTRRSTFYADVDAGNLEKPARVAWRRKPGQRRRGGSRGHSLLGVNVFADYHRHREGMARCFGAPLENL